LKHVKKLTGLHGRWEIVHHHPTVVLDVAHNEDGIKEVIKQVELSDYHGLHIVLGMVKDKEIEKILTLLPKMAAYYFTHASIPRALRTYTLMEKARAAGLYGFLHHVVISAVRQAMAKANKHDLILVCGSVFTVGEVLPIRT